MHLAQAEIEQFYQLWYALVWGINEKHKVIPHFTKPVYGKRITVSQREFMRIRDKMWEHPKWIARFLKENDNEEFTEQERGIILSWSEYFVPGRFIIMRHLKNYSVFMRISENEPMMLYGAKGISDSFKDICQGNIHLMVETVLIPFGDKIIYDTFLASSNISFGSGMRESLNDEYRTAKQNYGIITSLCG